MQSITQLLSTLGVDLTPFNGKDLPCTSPITGAVQATLRTDTPQQVTEKITRAHAAFERWRTVPAPRRG